MTGALEGAPLLAVGAALLLGAASVLVSPCHLAGVPLVVSVVQAHRGPTRRASTVALLFGLGVLLSFAVVGGLTLAAGWIAGDLGRFGHADVRVRFVCVHNAARGRMAEALLRELGGPRFEVTSAGFEPREVNPLVVEALADIALPLSRRPRCGPRSSSSLRRAGTSITSSASATRSTGRGARCFPASRSASTGCSPDPATFTGSHDEQLARVIEVREALRTRIDPWLATLSETGSTPRKTTRT